MRDWFTGKTPEEKLNLLETIVTRMSRRLHKHAVVLIPPVPICFMVKDVPEGGELFRYMFASNGTIDTIYIFTEHVEKGVSPIVSIKANPLGTTETFEITFPYGKGPTIIKREMSIKAGMRIIVSTSDPTSVSGIWFACPFVVEQKGAEVQQYLLDTVLANVEAEELENAGKTEEGKAE